MSELTGAGSIVETESVEDVGTETQVEAETGGEAIGEDIAETESEVAPLESTLAETMPGPEEATLERRSFC